VIIVTGSIVAKPEHVDEVQRLAVEHVTRSRLEPGCLMHSVQRDVENVNRFVFVEHWADADTLRAHFAVPASGEFVTLAASLADGSPSIEIYEASPIRL
jgi:quinol monooxygenase YgiN